MKIVIDSNVYLSAFLTQGLSNRVLDICIDKHEIFISPWIIAELQQKLKKKFKVKQPDLNKFLNFIRSIAKTIEPRGDIPDISRDKDDNNILFLAEYTESDLIITGDKDLLILKKHRKTVIINPRDYMEMYYKR